MNRDVTFSHRAKLDLDHIWDFTCQRWSRTQANDYLQGIRAVLDTLAAQPELGPLRKELTPSLRAFPHKSHLILYEDQEGGIYVFRIVHSRSDWLSDFTD